MGREEGNLFNMPTNLNVEKSGQGAVDFTWAIGNIRFQHENLKSICEKDRTPNV